MRFFIACALFIALAACHGRHTCIHDSYVVKLGQDSIEVELLDLPTKSLNGNASEFRNKRQVRGPFRVFFNTTLLNDGADAGFSCYAAGQSYTNQANGQSLTCDASDVISASVRTYIVDTLLKFAGDTFREMVQVNQEANFNYLFPSGRYQTGANGPVDIPTTIAAPNTDFYVFVTARPIVSANNVIFFAGTIATHPTTGRPLIGYINVGVRSLNASDPKSVNEEKYVAVHELTHAIGFSSSRFPTMRDANGVVRVNPIQSIGGRNYMATPAVIRASRSQFNCQTVPGGLIEDEGGAGTAGSHWERAMFMGDFMCGISYESAVISNMTLAWMEDSGWYFPDYSKADLLKWGYGLGCIFANPNSCSSRSGLQQGEFYGCSGGQVGCTFDRSGQGPCSGSSSNEVMNGCTYFAVYSNRNCRWGAEWAPGNPDGSSISETSVCVNSNLGKGFTEGRQAQTCYPMACSDSTSFFLEVGGKWVRCPFDTTIEVSGYAGEIECPLASENMCWDSSKWQYVDSAAIAAPAMIVIVLAAIVSLL